MKNRVLILILALMSMLGPLSIDAFLPGLPAIAAHFAVTMSAAQQALSIYLFAYAFMVLFYGTLSDSFGRRPVVIIAIAVYTLATIGAGMSPSLGWLLFFRWLQGMSAGAGNVIGLAIVGDLFTGAEARRIMSYISMIFGVAPAVAPILGGWLMTSFGWRSIFGFIGIFSILLLGTCLRYLPESLRVEERHPLHLKAIVLNYWRVSRHAQFLFRCIALALTFTGVMVYVGCAPSYLLDVLHLTPTQYGWLFIPLIGGMTLASWVAASMSHRVSSRTLILAGFTIMGISTVASALYHGLCAVRVPWAIIPLATYSFGMSIGSAAMSLSTMELFPKARGMASSFQNFAFMILFAILSGFICPFLFGSGFKMSLAGVAGYLLSLTFWLLGRRETEESKISIEADQNEIAATS
jgi:DHA1 family bicyclomycin/chloramphenicol resistance-like MFS transporter